MHIGVSAYGRDFLTDGGKGLYIPDKWRNYFLSTNAHNTILVDGFGQLRIPDHATHRAESALKGNWFSDDVIDFAGGVFENGYGPDKIKVKHSRYVLYKKEDYWLIIDELSGEGEHTFESLFHFLADEVDRNEENLYVQTHYLDGKNLRLLVAGSVPLKVDIIKGQENPEQGWIYHGGKRVAKPKAILFLCGEFRGPEPMSHAGIGEQNRFSISILESKSSARGPANGPTTKVKELHRAFWQPIRMSMAFGVVVDRCRWPRLK